MKILNLILLLYAVQSFAQTPELIFRSGFEPNVIDSTNGVSSDMFGIDNSVSPPNDWVNDLDNHPNIGAFDIQYQGGNDSMRLAEIVPDPTDPFNNVLEYWIKYPNVSPTKGRVQANIYNNNNIDNLYYSIRMYLPSDLDTLKYASTEIKWLTLMEFWNNPAWSQNYGFRVTVNLQKIGTAADSLRLGVHGQIKDTLNNIWVNVWDTTNMSFSVPIAKWMTVKINYIEGDNSTGKFHLSVTPEGEPETVVFDITNYTHHPSDPSPDGLSHFNPFKLYTSAEIINGLTNIGRLLHVYWDDFELWKDQPLAIQENSTFGNFRIYPNPTNQSATLEFNNQTQKAHTLKLCNIQGQIVRTITNITTDKVIIEKDNLPIGMYFFRLYNEKNISITGKLILK